MSKVNVYAMRMYLVKSSCHLHVFWPSYSGTHARTLLMASLEGLLNACARSQPDLKSIKQSTKGFEEYK